MLKVKFSEGREPAMGSAFLMSEVSFVGEGWKPQFKNQFYAGVVDYSPSGLIALAAWEVPIERGPAFSIVLLDPARGKIYGSSFVLGGVKSLSILDDRHVGAKIFRHPGGYFYEEIEMVRHVLVPSIRD